MKKTSHQPKIVSVADKRGDELLSDSRAAMSRQKMRPDYAVRDFQSARRLPIDAPMATYEPTHSEGEKLHPGGGLARIMVIQFLLAVAFVAGIAIGKML